MIRIQPRATLLPCTTFFFFNDTATTEIYTLSLHDALPISVPPRLISSSCVTPASWAGSSVRRRMNSLSHSGVTRPNRGPVRDRKSTRLNSSHANISYAVFCLKKKKSELQSRQYLVCHILF